MIVENPLFKEKSSDSVSITEYSLLADDQHRGLIAEPRQHFHKLLAKPWPFRFLKGLHWLLLLLITVLCVVGNADYNFTLRWSSCWNNALNGFLEKLNNNQNALVQITIVPLLMATGSLAAQRWKGKTQLPSIALADFSLGWAFILVHLLLIFYYGLRSYIEYSWFYPKLRDPSTSLAELTEWGKNSYRREPWYDGRYRPYWRTTTEAPSTTISPEGLRQMEERKLFIMARLLLDPTITILALVAVLLQAGLLLSISSAIKRSRVWASNYRLEHPNCTEQEAKYAKFWPLGLIKLAQVVIPMAFLVFWLPLSERLSLTNAAIYASLAFACLINRLRYIKRVRFCKGYSSKTQAEETEQLANFRRMDCFFNICGFFLFGIQRIFVVNYYRESALKLYVDCAILGLFLIASLYIYSLQPGAGKLGNIRKALRIPRICINVEFNVKKDDEEEEKTKKEKKDDVEEVAAGQVPKAEEETVENQIQQKTCPAPAEI